MSEADLMKLVSRDAKIGIAVVSGAQLFGTTPWQLIEKLTA
jgi:hypothetical protein